MRTLSDPNVVRKVVRPHGSLGCSSCFIPVPTRVEQAEGDVPRHLRTDRRCSTPGLVRPRNGWTRLWGRCRPHPPSLPLRLIVSIQDVPGERCLRPVSSAKFSPGREPVRGSSEARVAHTSGLLRFLRDSLENRVSRVGPTEGCGGRRWVGGRGAPTYRRLGGVRPN